jgi:hypothetical protein
LCNLGAITNQIGLLYTDKKENKSFLIHNENSEGSGAKSYMNNSLLLYGEIFEHFLIY